MSNCRITPVLVLVLVFSFMFGGCGRDMDLRELRRIRFRRGPGRKMRPEKAQRGRRKRFPGRAVPAVRMCPVRRSV